MGDRYDRRGGRRGRGLAHLQGKPPPEIIAWGLTPVGHNGGPPLDEPVANLFVRWRWKKVHAQAWKNPSPAILKFRMVRAEAAGVSYRDYMLELLDTGRHLQRDDVAARDRHAGGVRVETAWREVASRCARRWSRRGRGRRLDAAYRLRGTGAALSR